MLQETELKEFLEYHYNKYNRPDFIETDPIQIPHLFSLPEDVEIAGFLTAILSWGQRKTIISKSLELIKIMDYHPYDFIMNGERDDFETVGKFYHRTFNGIDAVFFLNALKNIYTRHGGLGGIFKDGFRRFSDVKEVLSHFRNVFFEIPHPERTLKHIPDVTKKASAKRINMFLRWMVRKDNRGVDLGLWNEIDACLLKMPLDIHSGTVARKLGLLKRKQNDWQAVCELTGNLSKFDPADPVKYDFALFGLGVFERF